jgi:hypothetical protein
VIAVTHNVPANMGAPAGPTIDPMAFELAYWDTIKTSSNPNDFKSYLEKYPDGQFATLARNKIGGLQPTDAPVNNSQAEITYWDAIKNSNNPSDYRAYLKRYPNGIFSDLAKTRLAPFEAAEAAKANEEAIKRQTRVFRGMYGDVMFGKFEGIPGQLLVAPGKVQFAYEGAHVNDNPLDCASFRAARVDGAFIREIAFLSAGKKIRSDRFQAQSPAEAANALDAIKQACTAGNSSSPLNISSQPPTALPEANSANGNKNESVEEPRSAVKTFDKIRNGSSKAAPEGTLRLSGAGIEFTSNGGDKTLFIKCSEVLKVSTSNMDKLLTIKTTSGDHHFNDLVSIFGSSPSLKPIGDDIRSLCKVSK